MIEIIKDIVGLKALTQEWNELHDRVQSPLLRHEWFVACAEAFCPPEELCVLVAREDGTVTAIAPLVVTRRMGIESLELLGSWQHQEPSGFLYRDPGAIKELLMTVFGMRMPTLFSRLSVNSPEKSLMHSLQKDGMWFTLENSSWSPWIPMNKPWDTFEASISSSRRSSLRRARRRAEESGETEFQVLAPFSEGLESLLDELFRVEAASWKGRKNTAILNRPNLKRFFALYASQAARLRLLRLGFFRIDGYAVAALLGVAYANRFWVLKTGYDDAWAHCSPGILLMHEVIRWAFQQRYEAFEFLGNNEPWIQVWTKESHQYETCRMIPVSPSGILWMGADLGRMLNSKLSRLRS